MSSSGNSRFRMNEGDWICPDSQCGNVNFARRFSCNRCGKEKCSAPPKKKLGHEIGKAAAEKSRGLFSADDWQCGRCGNVNWTRRQQCNMCNAPKFGEVEERTGLGGGYNERENVEYIEREESDGEFDDYGRRKKKFRKEDKTPESKDQKSEKDDKDKAKAAFKEPDSEGDEPRTKPSLTKDEEEDDDDDDDDEEGDLSKYDLSGWGDDDDEKKDEEDSKKAKTSSGEKRKLDSSQSSSSSSEDERSSTKKSKQRKKFHENDSSSDSSSGSSSEDEETTANNKSAEKKSPSKRTRHSPRSRSSSGSSSSSSKSSRSNTPTRDNKS